MPDVPQPIGARSLAIYAAAQGAEAYRDGAVVLACPYGPTRPYSRRAWVAGYDGEAQRAGARMPADVADDTVEDAPTPE